ncbi:MAG TPA: 2-oxoglutarate dehydrogenase E1 component [Polyangiaceae bacterium]|jgi:2-oxoglutarate dehydrogenase E1 component|nr:2-oxoglutarate dehydrogenase E1 component [Polyangiaceae bacterium]
MSQAIDSAIGNQNVGFLEELYEQYLKDPSTVPEDYRAYFASLGGASATKGQVGPSFQTRGYFGGKKKNGAKVNGANAPAPAVSAHGNGHGNGATAPVEKPRDVARTAPVPSAPAEDVPPVYAPATEATPPPAARATNGANGSNGASVAPPSSESSSPEDRALAEGALRMFPVGSLRPVSSAESLDIAIRQDRVDQLVRAYRVRGHMIAKIDPLGMPRAPMAELDPKYYHLTEEDMDRRFSSRTIYGTETLTLREILERLRNTYCRSIGVEFMHMHDLEPKNWLQERMEGTENRLEISVAEQRRIVTLLTDAVILEEFIQRKYLGAKSFSLEGSESLIPLLALTIERAAEHGVDEITLGMAHRGRLNVLANIMGKNPRDIFREFEDLDPQLYRGRGDVKYHMGYSSNYQAAFGRKMHLSLCFNPSHLEFVNPVVAGRVRAKQDRNGDGARSRKLALMIHGDAAMAGEGIVQETFNLSQLRAYNVGGSIHVVVNNQIGFTTPPWESRSSPYATDIAKMLQIPIFHVNGEDPEAVAQVVRLAMDFRVTFKRDVVIDMYGYRRHGHNEGDEPSFTQPVLYRAIAKRVSVRDGYLEHLTALGGITREDADQIAVERRSHLEGELTVARQKDYKKVDEWLGGYWSGYIGGPESSADDADTSVDPDALKGLVGKLCEIPESFTPHPKIVRLLEQRKEMARGGRPLDWGTAELAAFASIVTNGTRVRFTGQDVPRGTFSQRHAVLYDYENGKTHTPLAHLSPTQAQIEIYNSALSEAGVLGFEWGYSLDYPEGLIVWEAQYGDFVNVAQVIIDQFIMSAEDKWKRLSGLVLLLPHGFEGSGPEHSSARLERWLTLAAEDNAQIVQPSTPSQHFHLLRRQVMRRWRKPLVVFTPKSLLRHPLATSGIEETANGRFHRVLPDELTTRTKKVGRIILCSGRLYYDLVKHRQDTGREDVAIIRLEQLYPLPKKSLLAALDAYPDGISLVWAQDEPENMGAWTFLRMRLGERVFGRWPLSVVSREESASPATGSMSSHRMEQQEIIQKAFGVAYEPV